MASDAPARSCQNGEQILHKEKCEQSEEKKGYFLPNNEIFNLFLYFNVLYMCNILFFLSPCHSFHCFIPHQLITTVYVAQPLALPGSGSFNPSGKMTINGSDCSDCLANIQVCIICKTSF